MVLKSHPNKRRTLPQSRGTFGKPNGMMATPLAHSFGTTCVTVEPAAVVDTIAPNCLHFVLLIVSTDIAGGRVVNVDTGASDSCARRPTIGPPDGFTRSIGSPLVDGSSIGMILAPKTPQISPLPFPGTPDVTDVAIVAVAVDDVLGVRESGESVGTDVRATMVRLPCWGYEEE